MTMPWSAWRCGRRSPPRRRWALHLGDLRQLLPAALVVRQLTSSGWSGMNMEIKSGALSATPAQAHSPVIAYAAENAVPCRCAPPSSCRWWRWLWLSQAPAPACRRAAGVCGVVVRPPWVARAGPSGFAMMTRIGALAFVSRARQRHGVWQLSLPSVPATSCRWSSSRQRCARSPTCCPSATWSLARWRPSSAWDAGGWWRGSSPSMGLRAR